MEKQSSLFANGKSFVFEALRYDATGVTFPRISFLRAKEDKKKRHNVNIVPYENEIKLIYKSEATTNTTAV